jgi:hypothetical protein
MKSLFFAASAFALLACTAGTVEDSSMYLTGTEEYAVQGADGSFHCDSPKKVLICHIPPGNPDNAHTICVGEPAVDPHVRLHGDYVGECNPTGGGDEGDVDAGAETVVDAATPPPAADAGGVE